MNIQVLRFIVCLGLLSCQDFAVEKRVVGKYSIVAADDGQYANLGFQNDKRYGYGTVV